jgi:uncharacterized protein (TIGR03118 family)
VGSLHASFSVVSASARQIARSRSTAVWRDLGALPRRRFAGGLRDFIPRSLAQTRNAITVGIVSISVSRRCAGLPDRFDNAAQTTDSHLVNAWGISYPPTGPCWVSSNQKGLAVLYNVNPTTNATTKLGLEVTIPGDGTVTGQAFNAANGTGAFNNDVFLFVNEDGTISGWRNGLGTTAEQLQVALDANIYKGATFITVGGHSYLLSANFRAGTIDVLKGDTAAPDLAGRFTDPNLSSGYAPFNIQVLNGRIYVSYALQDAAKHDDAPGAGHGFVNEFDTSGSLIRRIATQGMLNSPWGAGHRARIVRRVRRRSAGRELR